MKQLTITQVANGWALSDTSESSLGGIVLLEKHSVAVELDDYSKGCVTSQVKSFFAKKPTTQEPGDDA